MKDASEEEIEESFEKVCASLKREIKSSIARNARKDTTGNSGR